LDANTEDHLNIDDLLFQGGIENAKMPFAALLDLVSSLTFGLRAHDLVQVHVVVEKVVKLEAFERLQHLFRTLLQ